MTLGVQARELDGTGGTHTYLSSVLPHLLEAWRDDLVLFHAGDRPPNGVASAPSDVASTPSEAASTPSGVTSTPSEPTHVDSKTNAPVLSDHVVLPLLLRRYDVDVAWFPKNVVPIAHDGPSVVTVHDLGHFVQPDFYPLLDRVYMKAMIRHACRVADRIVAVSENTKADVLRYTSADPDSVDVIHHGVDDRFRAEPSRADVERIRDEYELASTVVYGGNVGRRKNVRRLVAAFEDAAFPGDSDAELVFTGPRPSGGQARTIEAHDAVRHLGYVASDDLPLLYRAASLFVYPSLYEGFGLPPLEAMACGTPVVASTASSIPEVVGDAAWLVDPYDDEQLRIAMETVLTDDALARRLASAGRARADEFSWRETAERLVETFRSVADARPEVRAA